MLNYFLSFFFFNKDFSLPYQDSCNYTFCPPPPKNKNKMSFN